MIQNKERIKQLLDAISPERLDEFKETKMQEFLRLEFDDNFYWSDLPLNFFLTLFCYIVEEYQNAKMYLQSFMEETDNKTDTYYTNVLKYFECLEKGMTLEAISKIIPQDIIHSFSSAEQVFLK